jgi:class 3 adenylate cyclase
MPAVRRLAAILASDVAGYSRLMGADEEAEPVRRWWTRHLLIYSMKSIT